MGEAFRVSACQQIEHGCVAGDDNGVDFIDAASGSVAGFAKQRGDCILNQFLKRRTIAAHSCADATDHIGSIA